MDQIFVTNTNDFVHSDRYDGSEYTFPPGEKVLLPVVAARLFFGFQNPDKSEALIRQGWANLTPTDNDPDWGAKRLAKFVFTRGVMIEEPVESDVVVVEAEPEQA